VTDRYGRREKPQRDPTEGVRIIGDDEAAEAFERGDVSRRLSDDAPRFGDRPPAPAAPEGARPALRFPLAGADDPATVERPAPVPVQPRAKAPELSHWAGSAAEEVPNMSRRDPLENDDQGWSSFSGLGPRWRDDVPPVEPARGQARQWGPPNEPPRGAGGRPDPGVPVNFDDEGADPTPGRSVFGEGPASPTYDDAYGDDAYGDDAYDDYDDYEDGYYPDEATAAAPSRGGGDWAPPDPATVSAGGPPSRPKPRAGAARRPRGSRDRDMRTAVGVGVGLVAVALALLNVLGPLGGMVLVVPILGYATYEFLESAAKAGFEPLTYVGVAATAGMAITAYNYGEGAMPLVLVLMAAVSFLWYLIGAGDQQPAGNIGVSMLGVVWIGLFGSFAALLLSVPTYGVSFLLAAVVPTIAYDVGGLFVGRSAGSRALSPASPNKTVEGLAGGMFLAVVAGAVFGAVGPAPFDGVADGIKLGLVAALAAPVGDLAESLIKRDLDLKDMGSILPGHGGLLDRFDALLFVLPAVWYLARLSDFFVT
jgi:CDP-diglyceride synthetase